MSKQKKNNVVVIDYYDAYLADKITNVGRKTLSDIMKRFDREKKLKRILNGKK